MTKLLLMPSLAASPRSDAPSLHVAQIPAATNVTIPCAPHHTSFPLLGGRSLDLFPAYRSVQINIRQNKDRSSAPIYSALAGGHRKECSRLLLHVLAAAIWARDCFLFVLCQCDDLFKRLIAVLTDVVVNGHDQPPTYPVMNEL